MIQGPLWLRVGLYAAQQQDERGIVLLSPGQLREVLDPSGCMSSQQVSHAIRDATKNGLLLSGSTARCLLPAVTGVRVPA